MTNTQIGVIWPTMLVMEGYRVPDQVIVTTVSLKYHPRELLLAFFSVYHILTDKCLQPAMSHSS